MPHAQSSISSNGKLDFGKFVQALRKQRIYFDRNEYPKQWSQEKLAEEADLTVRQVSRIEQGQVTNLLPYLEPLATAFNLTEMEKVAFYAKAGYVYQARQHHDNRTELATLLSQLPYPASVRTPLWDFVAINAYHRVIRGDTDEVIDKLHDDERGPNLLWLLFDPQFEATNATIHEGNWQAEAIWSFRATSFSHVATKRYRFLINEMKRFPDFDRAWRLSNELPDFARNPEQRRRPTSKIAHLEFGVMEFMSLRLPHRYFGQTEVSVYVPTEDSQAPYLQFRESIATNDVTFFPERPLD